MSDRRTWRLHQCFGAVVVCCLLGLLFTATQLPTEDATIVTSTNLADNLHKKERLSEQVKRVRPAAKLPRIMLKHAYRPNTLSAKDTSSHTAPTSKFAYVTYATSNEYSCSAMILLDSIRKTKADASIHLVILHTKGVSRANVAKIKANGMLPIEVPYFMTVGAGTGSVFRDSMTKINVFGLEQYERIVYLDSDSFVVRNLDHLFHLPRHFLYGVQASWMAINPFFTSRFLVIEPATEKLKDILKSMYAIAVARKNQQYNKYPDIRLFKSHQTLYDMHILNILYRQTLVYLPPSYAVSNEEFLNSPSKRLSQWNGTTTDELAHKAYIVHFSASPNGGSGKPWHSWNHRVKQPVDAHPLFAHLFQRFWDTQARLCICDNPLYH